LAVVGHTAAVRSSRSHGSTEADKQFYHAAQQRLDLIHRYRHFILPDSSGNVTESEKLRVVRLLGQTYGGKRPGKGNDLVPAAAAPKSFWDGALSTVWNPNIDAGETAYDIWSDGGHGRKGITVIGKVIKTITTGKTVSVQFKITGIYIVERDSHGNIVYAEPRAIRKGVTGDFQMYPDKANYEFWESQAGSLYEETMDFIKQRQYYQAVNDAYQVLLKVYPLLVSEPDFEQTFESDEWKSLLEFTKPQYFNLLCRLGRDDEWQDATLDFIEMIRDVWNNLERPITPEEYENVKALCQMIRDFQNHYQLAGGHFARGQKRGPMTEDKHVLSFAEFLKLMLEANPSYLTAMSIRKRRETLYQQAEAEGNEFVSIDFAAGTGAVNEVGARLGLSEPGPLNKVRELDIDPESLGQARSAGYPNTPAVDLRRKPKDEPGWAKAQAFLQTEGAVENSADIYPPDYSDFNSFIYIADFITPEQFKAMMIGANLVSKIGSEQNIGFPQSWRIPPAFLEALDQLGFDVTVPLRGRQKMKDSWRQRIIDSYDDKDYGRDIADAACAMREKQFVILQLRKRETIDPQLPAVKNLPAEAFEIEKTDTGQRGKSTGGKPYHYDPEAQRRRWEILKWVLNGWGPEDVEIFDPFSEGKDGDGEQMMTREEVEADFEEIKTENALQHLYNFRFLFRPDDKHFYYETVCNFYTSWKSKRGKFLKRDVEILKSIYRGRTLEGNRTTTQYLYTWDEVLQRIEASRNHFQELANTKKSHRARNTTLANEAADLKRRIEAAREKIQRDTGSEAGNAFGFWAVPKEKYAGPDLAHPIEEQDWGILRRPATETAELSINLLAGLLVYSKFERDTDDDIFEILSSPDQKYRQQAAEPPDDGGAPTDQDETAVTTVAQMFPVGFFEAKSVQRDLFAAVGRAIDAVERSNNLPANKMAELKDVIAYFRQPHALDFYPRLAGLSIPENGELYQQLERWYKWHKYFRTLQEAYRQYGKMVTAVVKSSSAPGLGGNVSWSWDATFKARQSSVTRDMPPIFDMVLTNGNKTVQGMRVFHLGKLPDAYDFAARSDDLALQDSATGLAGLMAAFPDHTDLPAAAWENPLLEVSCLFGDAPTLQETFNSFPQSPKISVAAVNLEDELVALTGAASTSALELPKIQRFLQTVIDEANIDLEIRKLEVFIKLSELKLYGTSAVTSAMSNQTALLAHGARLSHWVEPATKINGAIDVITRGDIERPEDLRVFETFADQHIRDLAANRGNLYQPGVSMGKISGSAKVIDWEHDHITTSSLPLDTDQPGGGKPRFFDSEMQLIFSIYPHDQPQAAMQKANLEFLLWRTKLRSQLNLWGRGLDDSEQAEIRRLVHKIQSLPAEAKDAAMEELRNFYGAAPSAVTQIRRINFGYLLVIEEMNLNGAFDHPSSTGKRLLMNYGDVMRQMRLAEPRREEDTRMLDFQIITEMISDAKLPMPLRLILVDEVENHLTALVSVVDHDVLFSLFRSIPKFAFAVPEIYSQHRAAPLPLEVSSGPDLRALWNAFDPDRHEMRALLERFAASPAARREMLDILSQSSRSGEITEGIQPKVSAVVNALMSYADLEDVTLYLMLARDTKEQRGSNCFIQELRPAFQALERILATGEGRDQFQAFLKRSVLSAFCVVATLEDYLTMVSAGQENAEALEFPNLQNSLALGVDSPDPVIQHGCYNFVWNLRRKLASRGQKLDDIWEAFGKNLLRGLFRKYGFQVEDYHMYLRMQPMDVQEYRVIIAEAAEAQFREVLEAWPNGNHDQALKFADFERFQNIFEHYLEFLQVPQPERDQVMGRDNPGGKTRFEKVLDEKHNDYRRRYHEIRKEAGLPFEEIKVAPQPEALPADYYEKVSVQRDLFSAVVRTIDTLRKEEKIPSDESPALSDVLEYFKRDGNLAFHPGLAGQSLEPDSALHAQIERFYQWHRYLLAREEVAHILGKHLLGWYLQYRTRLGLEDPSARRGIEDAGFVMSGQADGQSLVLYDHAAFLTTPAGKSEKVRQVSMTLPGSLPLPFMDHPDAQQVDQLAVQLARFMNLRTQSTVEKKAWTDARLAVLFLHADSGLQALMESVRSADNPLPAAIADKVEILDGRQIIELVSANLLDQVNNMALYQKLLDFVGRIPPESETQRCSDQLMMISDILAGLRMSAMILQNYKKKSYATNVPDGATGVTLEDVDKYLSQMLQNIIDKPDYDLDAVRNGLAHIRNFLKEKADFYRANSGTELSLGRWGGSFLQVESTEQYPVKLTVKHLNGLRVQGLVHPPVAELVPAAVTSLPDPRSNLEFAVWLIRERAKLNLWGLDDDEKQALQHYVNRVQTADSAERNDRIEEFDNYLASASSVARRISRIIYAMAMMNKNMRLEGTEDYTQAPAMDFLRDYYRLLRNDGSSAFLIRAMHHLQVAEQMIRDARMDLPLRLAAETSKRTVADTVFHERPITGQRDEVELCQWLERSPGLAALLPEGYVRPGWYRVSVAQADKDLFRDYLQGIERGEMRANLQADIRESSVARKQFLKLLEDRLDQGPLTSIAQVQISKLVDAYFEQADIGEIFEFLFLSSRFEKGGDTFLASKGLQAGSALEKRLSEGPPQTQQFFGVLRQVQSNTQDLATVIGVARMMVPVDSASKPIPYPHLNQALADAVLGADPVVIVSAMQLIIFLQAAFTNEHRFQQLAEIETVVSKIAEGVISQNGFGVERYYGIYYHPLFEFPKNRILFMEMMEKEFRRTLQEWPANVEQALKFSKYAVFERFINIAFKKWNVPQPEQDHLWGRTTDDRRSRFDRILDEADCRDRYDQILAAAAFREQADALTRGEVFVPPVLTAIPPKSMTATDYEKPSVQRDLFAAVERAVESAWSHAVVLDHHFPTFEYILGHFRASGGLDFYPRLAGESLETDSELYRQIYRHYQACLLKKARADAFRSLGQAITRFRNPSMIAGMAPNETLVMNAGIPVRNGEGNEAVQVFDAAKIARGQIVELRLVLPGRTESPFDDHADYQELDNVTNLLANHVRLPEQSGLGLQAWKDPKLIFLYDKSSGFDPSAISLETYPGLKPGQVQFRDMAEEIAQITSTHPIHTALAAAWRIVHQIPTSDDSGEAAKKLQVTARVMSYLNRATELWQLSDQYHVGNVSSNQFGDMQKLTEALIDIVMKIETNAIDFSRISWLLQEADIYLKSIETLLQLYPVNLSSSRLEGEITELSAASDQGVLQNKKALPAIRPATMFQLQGQGIYTGTELKAEQQEANKAFTVWKAKQRARLNLWGLEPEEKDEIKRLVENVFRVTPDQMPAEGQKLQNYICAPASFARQISRRYWALEEEYRLASLGAWQSPTLSQHILDAFDVIGDKTYRSLPHIGLTNELGDLLIHLQILTEAEMQGDADLSTAVRWDMQRLVAFDEIVVGAQPSHPLMFYDEYDEEFENTPKLDFSAHRRSFQDIEQTLGPHPQTADVEEMVRAALTPGTRWSQAGALNEHLEKLRQLLSSSPVLRWRALKRVIEFFRDGSPGRRRKDRKHGNEIQVERSGLIGVMEAAIDPMNSVDEAFRYVLLLLQDPTDKTVGVFRMAHARIVEKLEQLLTDPRDAQQMNGERVEIFNRNLKRGNRLYEGWRKLLEGDFTKPLQQYPHIARLLEQNITGDDAVLVIASLGIIYSLTFESTATQHEVTRPFAEFQRSVLDRLFARYGFDLFPFYTAIKGYFTLNIQQHLWVAEAMEAAFRKAIADYRQSGAAHPDRPLEFVDYKAPENYLRFIILLSNNAWPEVSHRILGTSPQDPDHTRFDHVLDEEDNREVYARMLKEAFANGLVRSVELLSQPVGGERREARKGKGKQKGPQKGPARFRTLEENIAEQRKQEAEARQKAEAEARKKAEAEKRERLSRNRKIYGTSTEPSNWRNILTALSQQKVAANAAEAEGREALIVRMQSMFYAACLQFASMFSELEQEKIISPEQYQADRQFMAALLPEAERERFLAQTSGKKPPAKAPDATSKTKTQTTAVVVDHAPAALKQMLSTAAAHKDDPAWQWKIQGDTDGTKLRTEKIRALGIIRRFCQAEPAGRSAIEAEMRAFLFEDPLRMVARWAMFDNYFGEDFVESQHSDELIAAMLAVLGPIGQEIVAKQPDFVMQSIQVQSQASADQDLSYFERLHHRLQIMLRAKKHFFKEHYQYMEKYPEEFRRSLDQTALGWMHLPEAFRDPGMTAKVAEVLKAMEFENPVNGFHLFRALDGKGPEAQKARVALLDVLADPAKQTSFDESLKVGFPYLCQRATESIRTIEEIFEIQEWVERLIRRGAAGHLHEVLLKGLADRWEQLIEGEDGSKRFREALRRAILEDSSSMLLDRMGLLVSGGPLMPGEDYWASHPQLEKVLLETALDSDAAVSSQVIYAVLRAYFFILKNLYEPTNTNEQKNIFERQQRAYEVFLRQMFRSLFDQGGPQENYARLGHIFMTYLNYHNELPVTEHVMRFMKTVLSEAIQEGLRDRDFQKVQAGRLDSTLRMMMSQMGVSSPQQTQVVGELQLSFTRAIEHYPDGRKIYGEIIEAERSKLASPDLVQTLYEMIGDTIETYENTFHRFPENFEDLVPVLKTSRVLDSWPELAPYGLSRESLLYEAFEREFVKRRLRYDAKRLYRTEMSYAAFTASGEVANGMDRLKANVRLNVKQPLANKPAVFPIAADLVEFSSQGPIQNIYFFPTGRDTFDSRGALRFSKEITSYVMLAQRIAAGLLEGYGVAADFKLIIVPLREEDSHFDLSGLPANLRQHIEVTSFDQLETPFFSVLNKPTWNVAWRDGSPYYEALFNPEVEEDVRGDCGMRLRRIAMIEAISAKFSRTIQEELTRLQGDPGRAEKAKQLEEIVDRATHMPDHMRSSATPDFAEWDSFIALSVKVLKNIFGADREIEEYYNLKTKTYNPEISRTFSWYDVGQMMEDVFAQVYGTITTPAPVHAVDAELFRDFDYQFWSGRQWHEASGSAALSDFEMKHINHLMEQILSAKDHESDWRWRQLNAYVGAAVSRRNYRNVTSGRYSFRISGDEELNYRLGKEIVSRYYDVVRCYETLGSLVALHEDERLGLTARIVAFNQAANLAAAMKKNPTYGFRIRDTLIDSLLSDQVTVPPGTQLEAGVQIYKAAALGRLEMRSLAEVYQGMAFLIDRASSTHAAQQRLGLESLKDVWIEFFNRSGFGSEYHLLLQLFSLPLIKNAVIPAALDHLRSQLAAGEVADYRALENDLKGLALAKARDEMHLGLSGAKKEVDKLLEVDSRGRTVFDRAVIQFRRDRYDPSSSLVQKELYAAAAFAMSDFEKEQFRLPGNFDEYVAFLAKNPSRTDYYGATEGIDLTPSAARSAHDNQIYEAMKLAYTRVIWRRSIEEAFRSFARGVEIIDEYQSAGSQRKENTKTFRQLLPLKSQAGWADEEFWMADSVTSKGGKASEAHFYSLGQTAFDFETRPDLAHFEEASAVVRNLARVASNQSGGVDFRNARFQVRFLNQTALGRVQESLRELPDRLKTMTDYGGFSLPDDHLFKFVENFLKDIISETGERFKHQGSVAEMERDIKLLQLINQLFNSVLLDSDLRFRVYEQMSRVEAFHGMATSEAPGYWATSCAERVTKYESLQAQLSSVLGGREPVSVLSDYAPRWFNSYLKGMKQVMATAATQDTLEAQKAGTTLAETPKRYDFSSWENIVFDPFSLSYRQLPDMRVSPKSTTEVDRELTTGLDLQNAPRSRWTDELEGNLNGVMYAFWLDRRMHESGLKPNDLSPEERLEMDRLTDRIMSARNEEELSVRLEDMMRYLTAANEVARVLLLSGRQMVRITIGRGRSHPVREQNVRAFLELAQQISTTNSFQIMLGRDRHHLVKRMAAEYSGDIVQEGELLMALNGIDRDSKIVERMADLMMKEAHQAGRLDEANSVKEALLKFTDRSPVYQLTTLFAGSSAHELASASVLGTGLIEAYGFLRELAATKDAGHQLRTPGDQDGKKIKAAVQETIGRITAAIEEPEWSAIHRFDHQILSDMTADDARLLAGLIERQWKEHLRKDYLDATKAMLAVLRTGRTELIPHIMDLMNSLIGFAVTMEDWTALACFISTGLIIIRNQHPAIDCEDISRSFMAEFDRWLSSADVRRQWLDRLALAYQIGRSLSIIFEEGRHGLKTLGNYPNIHALMREGAGRHDNPVIVSAIFRIACILESFKKDREEVHLDHPESGSGAAILEEMIRSFMGAHQAFGEARILCLSRMLPVKQMWHIDFEELVEWVIKDELSTGRELNVSEVRRQMEMTLLVRGTSFSARMAKLGNDFRGLSRFERAAEGIRREMRATEVVQSPARASVERSVLLGTAAIVQGLRPPRGALTNLLNTIRRFGMEPVRAAFDFAATRIAVEPAYAAEIYTTTIPQLDDSAILTADDRLHSSLQAEGLRLHDEASSDVVHVVTGTLNEQNIVSILRSEQAMNLSVIWRIGQEMVSADHQEIEDRINRAIGTTGAKKRFRLIVSLASSSLAKALNETSQFLTELHGKGTSSGWADRVVYVLPDEVKAQRTLALKKVIRHGIDPADPNALGKEWFLLKRAEEESIGSPSPELEAFISGKGNDLRFDDKAIPSSWLAHFVQRDAEIAAVFAKAA
jgi:hypothetical protein